MQLHLQIVPQSKHSSGSGQMSWTGVRLDMESFSWKIDQILQENGIRISMTQSGDPLENAIAERVNGIRKGEWLNDLKLKDLDDCHKVLTRIITFYNDERPHMSVDMYTPSLAHRIDRRLPSRWKKTASKMQQKEKKDLLCNTQVEAVIV